MKCYAKNLDNEWIRQTSDDHDSFADLPNSTGEPENVPNDNPVQSFIPNETVPVQFRSGVPVCVRDRVG